MAKVLKVKNNSIFTHIIEIDGIGTCAPTKFYGEYGLMAVNIFNAIVADFWGIKIFSSQDLITDIVMSHEHDNLVNTGSGMGLLATYICKNAPQFIPLFFDHTNSKLMSIRMEFTNFIYEDQQDQINMPSPY